MLERGATNAPGREDGSIGHQDTAVEMAGYAKWKMIHWGSYHWGSYPKPPQ